MKYYFRTNIYNSDLIEVPEELVYYFNKKDSSLGEQLIDYLTEEEKEFLSKHTRVKLPYSYRAFISLSELTENEIKILKRLRPFLDKNDNSKYQVTKDDVEKSLLCAIFDGNRAIGMELHSLMKFMDNSIELELVRKLYGNDEIVNYIVKNQKNFKKIIDGDRNISIYTSINGEEDNYESKDAYSFNSEMNDRYKNDTELSEEELIDIYLNKMYIDSELLFNVERKALKLEDKQSKKTN